MVKDINLHIREAQWTPANDLTQLWNNNIQMIWGNGNGGVQVWETEVQGHTEKFNKWKLNSPMP